MRIHIVEDDPAVADALATVLEDLDHLPTTYADGETFLAEAQVRPADLVILDLALPGISGTDIALRLKAKTDPPRIIAISGTSRTKLQRHLRCVPGLQVLRKPLSIEMLAAAMA